MTVKSKAFDLSLRTLNQQENQLTQLMTKVIELEVIYRAAEALYKALEADFLYMKRKTTEKLSTVR